MPTYEFRCPQGHEFEKFYRNISGGEAQSACPQCGELSERMMSATGFAFKGSGFYLTDYGKNAHRDKGTPTPAAGGDGGGESGKSDSGKSEGGSKGDSGGTTPAAPSGGDSAKPAGGSADTKPAPKPAPAPAPKPKKGASE